ncbi:class I SAM-dependent methyltransferase [Neolewinella litorea]|uniref:Methyltransferase domain-containing protein n=1 Tax=Neolewinella litorea TaxID=2562452 RepID=A0A4S4NEN2_9BACT|nr:methyltransferase domain-containing protein [Neolewinella litorea]THH37959.1 methyltransferase domain-containing protein [Neolewinella litorea]
MSAFGSLLPPPLDERRGIPLYYRKSEEEVRQDVYERYDELVARQTALHLADELHGGYPLQPLADYLQPWIPAGPARAVADVGCSVGRLVGDIALAHPDWDCYGIDFSYQMLRQGRDYWTAGKSVSANLLRYGYPLESFTGHQLPNLQFALADAAALPFPDHSLDLLINTFLIDRLPDARRAFTEWQRVVKPGGRVVMVSPLNFLKQKQWEHFHPPIKIVDHLLREGWQLLDLTDPLDLEEPMDKRGNVVRWRTLALVLER